MCLHILDYDLASSLSLVVFLVCHDLREDVGCCLVEFVEVVLLRSGFLSGISEEVDAGMRYVLVLLLGSV